MREYAARAFVAGRSAVNRLDELAGTLDQPDGELSQGIQTARTWVMEHLIHDNHHLGMMECQKGLQTAGGWQPVSVRWKTSEVFGHEEAR